MNDRALFIAVLAATILQGQSQQTATPYTIGPDVSAPRVISKVEAAYNREAVKARREGDVLVELIVTGDGKASDVHEISKPVGCGLDESAIKAVEQWRFRPGEKNGKPVLVMSQIAVRFRVPH